MLCAAEVESDCMKEADGVAAADIIGRPMDRPTDRLYTLVTAARTTARMPSQSSEAAAAVAERLTWKSRDTGT
jgi:hypothetical protein